MMGWAGVWRVGRGGDGAREVLRTCWTSWIQSRSGTLLTAKRGVAGKEKSRMMDAMTWPTSKSAG
jgi:hypothetical protein